MGIANPNYRSEQLTKIVIGQATDAMKIGRDAGCVGLDPHPTWKARRRRLLKYDDQVLQQAAEQALRIDRAVWSDQALYEVAVAAGRAGQFARALQIARMIPRPTPRAEALIRISEAMAREASYVRYDLGGSVQRSLRGPRRGDQGGPKSDGPLE